MGKSKGAVTYDVTRLTARQVLENNEASRADNTDKIAAVLAACCTECPAEWGEPGETATFAELNWGQWKAATKAFREATRAMSAQAGARDDDGVLLIPVPAGVDYDLDRMPAREVAAFIRGLKREDIRTTAAMLGKIVTRVPAGWGAVSSPGTYLDQPYYDVFLPLAMGVLEDTTDSEKKEKSSSPSS